TLICCSLFFVNFALDLYIIHQFSNAENQIEIQLSEGEQQVYGDIEREIAAARQNQEEVIYASNTWVKQLAEIREDFDGIIHYITQATANPNTLI
ncbi:hypothetical protein QUA41_29395, partial [Microcoleus sp. Pol11C1]